MMPFVFLIALFYTGNASYASFTDTRPRDLYGWVPCNTTGRFAPLSDAQAADLVIGMTENRPDNTTANNYKPSRSELFAFLKSETRQIWKTPRPSEPLCYLCDWRIRRNDRRNYPMGCCQVGNSGGLAAGAILLESRWNQTARTLQAASPHWGTLLPFQT